MIYLFLAGIFLLTFLLGVFLEKIRVPWIFGALVLGLVLAFHNPFTALTSSEIFQFLSWLGMYFLLFLIGFELDLKKIRKMGRFIVKATLFIIFFEAFFGSFLVHFVFDASWFVSVLVALSFATVGEAVLIPILDEFGLTGTKLGQTILGIGTLDDVVEILMVVLAVLAAPFLLGRAPREISGPGSPLFIFFSLLVLFALTLGLVRLKRQSPQIKTGREAIFLLALAIFFLFIGLGKPAQMAAMGALLAGVAIKNFLPERTILAVERQIKTLTYSFFGPPFFLWVGVDTNIDYLIRYPLLVFLVIVVAKSAKILGSYLIGSRELGTKPSILMGIALGVRFSTSLVIIKFLFEKTIISGELYSVLIASAVAFKFTIPFLLSFLIKKWHPVFKTA